MNDFTYITFLGTGTSQGIPVIGCKCKVCISEDIHDKRLRTSAIIEHGEQQLLIDIGPDFRSQALANNIIDIDQVFITHEHNDHVIGLDDIRPIFFRKDGNVDFYCNNSVEQSLKTRFPYAFQDIKYPGAPGINLHLLVPFKKLVIGNLHIIPLPILHGSLEIFAYRINDIVYITDGSFIPEKSLELMKGASVMVINALRRAKHHSHFTLNEALEVIEIVQPKKAFLTHISHSLGLHDDVSSELPENVFVAFDGLKVN